MKYWKLYGLLLLLVVSPGGYSQLRPDDLKPALHTVDKTTSSPHLVEFYRLNGYRLAWVDRRDRMEQLLGELRHCSDQGLDRKAYQYEYLTTLSFQQTSFPHLTDSVNADLRITDAALHFFCALKKGNAAPVLRYDGLRYQPDCSDIPGMLWSYLEGSSLQFLTIALLPRTTEYRAMQQKLAYFNRIMADSSFKEVVITSAKAGLENKPLLAKLCQLGVVDALHPPATAAELTTKLKAAQKLLDVLSDGVLRKPTLAALNVPLSRRRAALRRALNYLRWLGPLKDQPAAGLLNIPSASLLVYAGGSILLESRVIVGKPSTPTPTLSSRITEVVLYPYWMVPHNIAVGELLPTIKAHPGYLADNNYQVLNKQGKVVDPASINWSALSAANFPYIIRQGTGCDNALGLVKFNFYNPFTVYWHDTPGKSLFWANRRFFSHGCMRVEKAMELAHILLPHNPMAIDTLTEKGCLHHQAPLVIPAEVRMPVMVIYSTVWYDKTGAVRFYGDVYRKG